MTSTAADATALTDASARALLRDLAAAAILALVVLAYETTGLDIAVSGRFYDAAIAAFPLRQSEFLEIVMHQWTKQLVITIAACASALYLLGFTVAGLRPYQRPLLFLALALAAGPLAVASIKATSARHCPWDLLQFGGYAPYFGMFDALPAGLGAGHCFPAGHASTGFCLTSFHFVGRALGRERLARWGLYGGITTGIALGAGRVLQGAHFPSHVAWSGIVCWTVTALLYAALIPARRAAFRMTACHTSCCGRCCSGSSPRPPTRSHSPRSMR